MRVQIYDFNILKSELGVVMGIAEADISRLGLNKLVVELDLTVGHVVLGLDCEGICFHFGGGRQGGAGLCYV